MQQQLNVPALLDSGVNLLSQSRWSEAAGFFRRAIEQNPLSSEAHFNLGKALLELNEAEHGRHFYEALRINPRNFEAAEYLGKSLFDVGAFEQAIVTFQHACRLRPGATGVRLDLAGTYAASRKFAQSVAEYEQLLREHPDMPGALSGLATVLGSIGRFAEARALFERALAIDPANEPARYHYAPLLLRGGEFAKGWPHYELRWMSGNSEEIARALPGPRWNGEPLAGKRLLVTCEQGLGDELMFASVFPEILAEAAGCTIECDQRLVPLFRRSFAGATLFSVDRKSVHWFRKLQQQLDTLPPFDYWTPAGSIPLHRRGNLASFPNHGGYLHTDAEKVSRWKQRLDELGTGLKVGISWRGGTAGTWTEIRSLSLAQLHPLLAAQGVHFVNLQYGESRAEIDAFAASTGIRIHHWPDAIADYDETAALVSALDVVISVCTAVVHLGGALGRPVWVLAPFVPEWRYGQEGPSMAWYPSVRVFRQPNPGDWDSVLKSATRALVERCARLAAEHSPGSALAQQQLGEALLHAGDPDGERHLEEALRLDPDCFEAAAALGRYHFQCGDYDRAAPLLAHACKLRPDVVEVRLELADSYLSSRQLDAAATEFERVRREHPNRPVALAGLANVHAACGRQQQARVFFERALDRQPENAWIGFHFALFLLRSGDFAKGWKLYEVRRRGFLNRDVFTRALSKPAWQGQALAGKRLLITAEQGLGDEIMFASIYGEIIREAQACIIECDQRLAPLLRRSFPTATVFGTERRAKQWNRSLEQNIAELPAFDYWLLAGTLPLYRRTSVDQFPKHDGYLAADEARIAHWRARLAELGPGIKVGISWRGGTSMTNAGMRSVTLDRLREILATPNAHFVSLQYGDCGDEIEAFAAQTGVRIHHWQEAIDNYDETAAMVCALDVVVSVCTAVVHLSGALGRPVWVMAPFVPEWRYGQRGPTMVWYPSVRMFRQPSIDDWAPVFAEVATSLRDLGGSTPALTMKSA